MARPPSQAAAGGFIPPMQALLAARLPEGPEWRYEVKLDGYRVQAARTAAGVRLLSRNGRALERRFPGIARALRPLAPGTVVDGELVALDEEGRPAFALLQNAGERTRLAFYAFDLLVDGGEPVWQRPLDERHRLLAARLRGLAEPIRLSTTVRARPAALMRAARRHGFEGLVAKRATSAYEPGRRSGAWVKVRLGRRQELVIGGYLPGPHGFDALLVGYYDHRAALRFVAKIRNGFVPRTKADLLRRFRRLETRTCPFVNLPERRGHPFALTAEVMAQCRWLRPRLVAEVAFADWTAADRLRHARFVALREDKDPREVRRERAA